MKCKQVQAALAIAPREWSEAERQQIEAHLLTCAACAAIARDYARQSSQLTALSRTSLSMAQQQAILAQVLRAPQSPWSRRLVNAFGAVAGVLILGVVVAALLWAFNNPTSLSLTATVTSVLTPTMTLTPTPASPTRAPAVPPSPAPPPTVSCRMVHLPLRHRLPLIRLQRLNSPCNKQRKFPVMLRNSLAQLNRRFQLLVRVSFRSIGSL